MQRRLPLLACAVALPSLDVAPTGTPMTYMSNDRQYTSWRTAPTVPLGDRLRARTTLSAAP